MLCNPNQQNYAYLYAESSWSWAMHAREVYAMRRPCAALAAPVLLKPPRAAHSNASGSRTKRWQGGGGEVAASRGTLLATPHHLIAAEPTLRPRRLGVFSRAPCTHVMLRGCEQGPCCAPYNRQCAGSTRRARAFACACGVACALCTREQPVQAPLQAELQWGPRRVAGSKPGSL